jgi:hypothetical protein
MAAGTPLHATTPAREAEAVGQKILSTARNATREDAKQAAKGVLDAAAAWLKKPWPQKLGDAAESVGDAMASPTTYVPAAGILRAGGKLVEAVEHTADAAGAIGKRGAKAAAKRAGKAATVEVAEHADEAAARRLLHEARDQAGRRAEGRAAKGATETSAEHLDDAGQKLRAKERRHIERAQSLEEKRKNPGFEEPVSEGWARWQANELEKSLGKDARRKLHDLKRRGEGDRSERQFLEDINDVRSGAR